MNDDWYLDYKGYRIQPRVIREERTGRWMAGKYTIAWGRGLARVEKLFADYVEYCDSEMEAREITIGLAKRTIDAGLVPRRPQNGRPVRENHSYA